MWWAMPTKWQLVKMLIKSLFERDERGPTMRSARVRCRKCGTLFNPDGNEWTGCK